MGIAYQKKKTKSIVSVYPIVSTNLYPFTASKSEPFPCAEVGEST